MSATRGGVPVALYSNQEDGSREASRDDGRRAHLCASSVLSQGRSLPRARKIVIRQPRKRADIAKRGGTDATAAAPDKTISRFHTQYSRLEQLSLFSFNKAQSDIYILRVFILRVTHTFISFTTKFQLSSRECQEALAEQSTSFGAAVAPVKTYVHPYKHTQICLQIIKPLR